MAPWHGDFKDLTRRTASDKTLRKKVFNIADNPKYGEYQCRFALMVYTFFDKKNVWWCHYASLTWSETLATRATQNECAVKNKKLAEE